MGFKRGEICYFIENGWRIKEAVVVGVSADFYTLRFDGDRGIRLRGSRLYKTIEKAEAITSQRVTTIRKRESTPYNYDH